MEIKHRNLSLNEIASRISDALLEEPYWQKSSMINKIRPILKIWIKRADSVKKHKSKTTTLHKLQWTVQSKQTEARYWLDALRKEIGEDAVKPYYDRQQEFLRQNDAWDYEEPQE